MTFYSYASAEALYDDIQNLDLRAIVSAGAGDFLWKCADDKSWAVEGGISALYEDFSTADNRDARSGRPRRDDLQEHPVHRPEVRGAPRDPRPAGRSRRLSRPLEDHPRAAALQGPRAQALTRDHVPGRSAPGHPGARHPRPGRRRVPVLRSSQQEVARFFERRRHLSEARRPRRAGRPAGSG